MGSTTRTDAFDPSDAGVWIRTAHNLTTKALAAWEAGDHDRARESMKVLISTVNLWLRLTK